MSLVAPPNCARSATKNQVKRDINRILGVLCEEVERKKRDEKRRRRGCRGCEFFDLAVTECGNHKVVLNVAGEFQGRVG